MDNFCDKNPSQNDDSILWLGRGQFDWGCFEQLPLDSNRPSIKAGVVLIGLFYGVSHFDWGHFDRGTHFNANQSPDLMGSL